MVQAREIGKQVTLMLVGDGSVLPFNRHSRCVPT